jgi:hypothetical protein
VKQLEPLGVITAGRGQQRGRRLLLQQVGLESVLLMDRLVSSQPARPRPLTVTPAVAMGILADRDCFPPRGAVHTCGRAAAIRTNDTRRATPVRHLAGRHRGGAGPDWAGDGPRQSALQDTAAELLGSKDPLSGEHRRDDGEVEVQRKPVLFPASDWPSVGAVSSCALGGRNNRVVRAVCFDELDHLLDRDRWPEERNGLRDAGIH